jgi:hypothetical protein
MVTPMSDELDPRLLALFAEKHEPLPSTEFVEAFLEKMDRARRIRTFSRIAMTVVAVLAGAWVMPSVLNQSAVVVRAIGEHSTSYAPLVISPWGWAVSMLIGLAVIIRTGGLRRR